jgi:type IV secretion system protein VirB1
MPMAWIACSQSIRIRRGYSKRDELVGSLRLQGIVRGYLWVLGHVCGAGVVVLISLATPVHADQISLRDFGRLATRCAPRVALSTLAAIARTESDFQPLMIHDNTTGITSLAASRGSAIQIAQTSLQAGHSLDLGIMQINSANLGPYGLTLSAAFTACRSMAVGAAILYSAYSGGDTHQEQQAALRAAVSRYNTGNVEDGFVNGYVRKVEQAAARLVPELDGRLATLGPLAVETSSGPAGVVRTLSSGRQTLILSDGSAP